MLDIKFEAALKLVYCQNDDIANQVIALLETAECIEFEDTGVGYYATIKLGKNVQGAKVPSMQDFNFSHPSFRYGGSFMCSLLKPDTIELEAVTFGGELWPLEFEIDEFRILDE